MKKHEGLPVVAAGIEIPGAAGGLRDAMKIEPAELHQGDTVYVLIETVVQKIRHDPMDTEYPDGDQRRVHILKAETATIVSGEDGERLLASHKEALRRAREIEGQGSLDDEAEAEPDDADRALQEAAAAL